MSFPTYFRHIVEGPKEWNKKQYVQLPTYEVETYIIIIVHHNHELTNLRRPIRLSSRNRGVSPRCSLLVDSITVQSVAEIM